MYDLIVGSRGRAAPLFDVMDYHLAIRAILRGITPGKVYVDRPDEPRAALAWSGHRFYLAGSAQDDRFNEDLRRLFAQEICPQATGAGRSPFVLYYGPDEWENKIGLILRGWQPMRYMRQYYIRREPPEDWRPQMPDGFAVRPVDRSLLENGSLKNLDRLMEEMCSERPSVGDFLDKSFGVCAVCEDEIAGWCLSEYNTSDRCEVGIETIEAYRRRGLGTLLTRALVERALAAGLSEVGWDCWAGNAPSVATAIKAGFHKLVDYPVYFGYFDQADHGATSS